MDSNPFKPGSGQTPPHLAGRGGAKHNINELLAELNEPHGVSSDAILYGPRGNGKTTLLGWVYNHCVAVPQHITVLRITPSRTASLKEQLMSSMGTALAQVTTEGAGSVGAMIARLTGKRSVVQSSQAEPLESFLIKQAHKTPLVLLVDEAHTMPAEWGHELLNVSQGVRQDAPFLLLLAGTPGIEEHMASIDVTFWDRSVDIPLGLLDTDATTAAITGPMSKAGISLAPNVLPKVAAESQGYPYFIQLWGKELWGAAIQANRKQIDEALLSVARDNVNDRKNIFYRRRYNEITRQGLERTAIDVANGFNDRETINSHELRSIVAGMPVAFDPPADVLATITKLKNLGYIWQGPATSDDWQPGIPSLMTHVLTRAQKLTPDNSGDHTLGM